MKRKNYEIKISLTISYVFQKKMNGFSIPFIHISLKFSFINYKPKYYITIILPMNKSINVLKFVYLKI